MATKFDELLSKLVELDVEQVEFLYRPNVYAESWSVTATGSESNDDSDTVTKVTAYGYTKMAALRKLVDRCSEIMDPVSA